MDSHVLGYLIDDFLDPEVNLTPLPVKDADGRIKLPALDNHGMGTVFEELIRRFNEDNNEEAGEHFTLRDVVQLMAKLLFLPVADRIESSTYSLYDGTCGTGGMLTVAEEALHELAEQHGKEVSIHLFRRLEFLIIRISCWARWLLTFCSTACPCFTAPRARSILAACARPLKRLDL